MRKSGQFSQFINSEHLGELDVRYGKSWKCVHSSKLSEGMILRVYVEYE